MHRLQKHLALPELIPQMDGAVEGVALVDILYLARMMSKAASASNGQVKGEKKRRSNNVDRNKVSTPVGNGEPPSYANLLGN